MATGSEQGPKLMQEKADYLHKWLFYAIFAGCMPQEQSATRERQRIDLSEPRRYKVTIYNDDFTTMDFVVRILTQVFYKSQAEAEQLMLAVHHSDKAVVGIYSYDVAVSRVQKATRMAREEGFPLRLTYEPE
jgi:ATP-dependent Clp protease adaptor protein ClpS